MVSHANGGSRATVVWTEAHQQAAVLEKASPIPPGGGDGETPEPVQAIGINKPLQIRIDQIYLGEKTDGEVLVTSAVKSIQTFDAAPRAIQALRKVEGPNQFIHFTATEPGSRILFYTPACLDSSLTITVDLTFDDFDKKRYERYTDLAAGMAALPIFASSAVLGPLGGPGAGAIIYTVKKAVKVALGVLDSRTDGRNRSDVSASYDLNLKQVGVVPSKSGWVLLRDDDSTSLQVSYDGWNSAVIDDDENLFYVDLKTAKLHYKETGAEVDDLVEPFVLIHVSGDEDEQLEAWTSTAVSAALTEKFFGMSDGVFEDVAALMSAYSDLRMTQLVQDVDADLKRATDPDKKKALEAKRTALLEHIQDRGLQDILTDK